MKHTCYEHVRVTLDLAGRMMRSADHGEAECEDDCCLLVYSVVRDCAYKIRETVEREHQDMLTRNATEQRS